AISCSSAWASGALSARHASVLAEPLATFVPMPDWFWDHWRTVLDITTALATVLAAGLAWRAIVQTKNESREAAQALICERRIDFELDLLDRLSVAYATGWDADATSASARTALDLLPPGEFEWCRGYVRAEGPRAVEVERAKISDGGG